MNPMDFLTQINGIDDDLIQSSVEFLQEDSMDKKTIRKGGINLSKLILVAAVIAGVVAVTALAAEMLPSIFSRLQQHYTEGYTESWAQNRAEIYEKAAQANQNFEAEYIDLPELNNSRIVIGEKYYDGENYLIGYRLDENKVPARFDLEPGSPEYKKLRMNYRLPGRNFLIEDCLEKGVWTQGYYDQCMAMLKKHNLENVKRASAYRALDMEVFPNVTSEEWDRVCRELRENGAVGVVYRETKLQYDVYLEDGTVLPNPVWPNKTYGGSGKGIDKTEFGNVFVYYGLPEEYRNLDTLTLYFKFKSSDVYHYIDAEKGAKIRTVPAGETLIPVTLTRTDK